MKRLSSTDAFESELLSGNLAGNSVRGGMTTMAAQAAKLVISTAGTVVLARLLTPADYGLIGMVAVVVEFAEMFKDAGLSMATVQRDRISREQISTLFWINIIVSAVLCLCVLTAAPLVSMFYGRPELTRVTAALSVSLILGGLMIQHQALLRRHMHFGSLASIQIGAQVVSLLVTILLAVCGWRYWALVAGTITSALVGSLLTFWFCPWLPGRMKTGTGVRDMLKFGGHLSGFNFINYFSRNLDNILIGKFIGANGLGLYSKAYNLFMMPIGQIRDPMTNVALPVLSALKDQHERYVRYYQRMLDITSSLTIPLTLYCIIEAPFLISCLLGPQWLGAVPVFRILAIAGLIQPIASTRGLVVLSCGSSDRYLYWGTANAVLMITAFVAGLPFGISGVAAAYAIANYVVLIPSLLYCFHGTPVTIRMFMKTLLVPLYISTFAAFVLVALKWAIPHDTLIAHLLFLAAFSVTYAGASSCRTSVRETVSLAVRSSSFSLKEGNAA